MRERIAVIGTGISGLSACYELQKSAHQYDLCIFEAAPRIGGHTATIDVELAGRNFAIDTGFIVFNDWTYPNFIRLLNEIGVDSQPTDMGFSLSCANTGLEYSGKNLGTLFTQRRNLLHPGHWKMLLDILRFNKESLRDIENPDMDANMRLGDYLRQYRYGRRFKDFYLVPMASAIWSCSLADVENMPLQFFVRFFKNHGLLSTKNRPQWRVIKGGSKAYLGPLCQGFEQQIRTSCPVSAIRREADAVYIDSAQQKGERFDQVILACHSDQALALLQDCSADEKEVLSAIPYNRNEVVVHTDSRLLPRATKAWSSWNYLLGRDQEKAVLTYNMNILQSIESDTTFCVTMNDSGSIDPEKIIDKYAYAHPEFSQKGIDVQSRWSDVNGVNRTWFCGAWWRNGFHEDGVYSALRVVEAINANNQDLADVA